MLFMTLAVNDGGYFLKMELIKTAERRQQNLLATRICALYAFKRMAGFSFALDSIQSRCAVGTEKFRNRSVRPDVGAAASAKNECSSSLPSTSARSCRAEAGLELTA